MGTKHEHPLLDFLKRENDIKSDHELSKALGINRTYLSKIRHGRPLSAKMKILIHKSTGMSIEDIEGFLGESNESTRTAV